MIWSSIQRFGTMAISFISNIVLARLLTPDDYGCIGMLMIFIVIANTFIDGGFGAALIQKKEPTQEDYSTVFYWNLFLAVILYGALYACAPAIARFYNIPLLAGVLRILGLVLIVNALSIIQSNLLRKQLQFAKMAKIGIASSILSVAIAIWAAYRGLGVWSLVLQQLLFSGFNSLFLWIWNNWRPTLIFSMKSFHELFGFGFYILSSNLLNALCNNIQGLIIGKFFLQETLGLYTQARKLEEVVSTSFSTVVDQVSYPVFSKIQHNMHELQLMLQKLISALAYISFPLMILLIVIAEPLIVFLFSEKWIACVPYFQILCVAGVAICLQGINYNAIAAIGKANSLFICTLIKRGLGLLYLVVGLWWGVNGLLWGMVAGSYTVYLINAYLVSKYIGYSMFFQIKHLLPIIFTALFSGIFAYIPILFMDSGLLSKILLQIIIYIAIYMMISVLCRLRAFAMFRNLITSLTVSK